MKRSAGRSVIPIQHEAKCFPICQMTSSAFTQTNESTPLLKASHPSTWTKTPRRHRHVDRGREGLSVEILLRTRIGAHKEINSMDSFSQYEGKTIAQVMSMVRREWMTDRQKWRAIQRHVKRIELNGRQASLVECQKCFELVGRKEVHCHHLNEVGQLASTSPSDIETYRKRMFVPSRELVPYCVRCHHEHHNN